MIYIIASATLDKKNKLKLKRLYATNDELSFVLDLQNGGVLSETVAKKEDFVTMHNTQRFFVNNLMYTSVRQLQGTDVRNALKLIQKQIEELKPSEGFDELVFNTINKYGVQYE